MNERIDRFNLVLDHPSMPQEMPPRDEAIIVWGETYPKWMVFECPCGCGNPTHVNLMKSHNPHWEWDDGETEGSITLSPSILNRVCGAHYFIRSNQVVWC